MNFSWIPPTVNTETTECMRFIDKDPDPTNSTLAITIFAIVYLNIFWLGLVGNLSIVCLTIRHRHLRTVQNIFILNLAISEVIVCLLSLPFTPVTNIYKIWLFGQPICHLLPLVQAVSIFVATFSLSAIAIDRYNLVVRPYAHPLTLQGAIAVAVILWIISVAVSFPYAYYMTLEEYPGYCGQFCSEHWPNHSIRRGYALIVIVLQFIIPFITMSFCYSIIFSRLKERANSKLKKINERSLLLTLRSNENGFNPAPTSIVQLKKNSTNCSPQNVTFGSNNNNISNGPLVAIAPDEQQKINVLAQQRRTTTILVSMVLLFGLTWLPQNVVSLMIEYDESSFQFANTNYTYLISIITHCVAMTTCVLNPILYAWLNPTFKLLFLEAFKRNNKQQNYGFDTPSTTKSYANLNKPKTTIIKNNSDVKRETV